ncbi:hypothetical protein MHU86_5924 [Fragilaria crotonensis]|nr:hypothetical protein MHU86_5924 [Fragilaria crotonensis]
MSQFANYLWEFSWRHAIFSCACIELSFYACYRWYLLPRAQILTQPGSPYRDYPCPVEDRVKLVKRICRRLERQAVEQPHHNFRKRFSDFMLAWFRPTDAIANAPPGLRAASFNSSSSGEASSDEEWYEDSCISKTTRWSIAGLKKPKPTISLHGLSLAKTRMIWSPPNRWDLKRSTESLLGITV